MSLVDDFMLDRFLTMFGEPRTDNLEAYMGEYRKALRGASGEVLSEATDALMKAHDKRSWPTVAECCKAVETAALARAMAARHSEGNKDLPGDVYVEPSPEERARVAALAAECIAGLTRKGASLPVVLPDVSRDAFTQMQANSRNSFHRRAVRNPAGENAA